MSKKKEAVDIFDEVVEQEQDLEKPQDDLQEGFIAESDSKSKMGRSVTDISNEPAEDIVKVSLDGQLTALGRETAKKLAEAEKFKVKVPINPMAKDDTFVTASINGWNFQVKRGEPVMLPVEIIDLLANAGYNPTLVR